MPQASVAIQARVSSSTKLQPAKFKCIVTPEPLHVMVKAELHATIAVEAQRFRVAFGEILDAAGTVRIDARSEKRAERPHAARSGDAI